MPISGNKYLDAHCHPQFPGYGADIDGVMLRAKEAGVKMVAVGTNSETSESAIRFAEKYEGDVWAAVGFHPSHFAAIWHHDKNEQTKDAPEIFDPSRLEELARHKKVVAIGECGLDYARLPEDSSREEEIKKQKEGFVVQIRLAKKIGKPLMIHCRNAFPDLIGVLEEEKADLLPEAGIIHFFTGTPEEAQKLLDLGFSFTFGGVITFVRDYDESLKLIPKERLLSETDSPYVTPAPYRGKRNEPAYVVEVVKKIAELKGLSEEEMRQVLILNAKRILRIDL